MRDWRSVRGRRPAAIVAAATLLLISCGGGTPSVGPGSASPSMAPSGADFALDVVPERSVGRTIPGARVVFLVTVSGAPADGEVAISADADGATIEIEPASLGPGTVGEVTVVAGPVTAEEELPVTIRGVRGSVEREASRTLALAPGTDELGPAAAEHLEPFVAWLATERPELGIGPETVWAGTPGSWVLVVEHYLYFSNEWELGLDWHVMMPPDDWSRIYLRHRWTEVAPSSAFEISSVTAATEPIEVEPPEAVWR